MTLLVCHRCGDEWPEHPALVVACPHCKAGPGIRCTRPSGHQMSQSFQAQPHIAREALAVSSGAMQPCRALSWDERHAPGTPPPAPPQRTKLRADAPVPPQLMLF